MIQKLLDLTIAKQKVEQLVLKVYFLLGQPANIRSEVCKDHYSHLSGTMKKAGPWMHASAAAESTK